MITWRMKSDTPVCTFQTKMDCKLTGRSLRARGEELSFIDSEFADDTAVIFNSRGDLENGIFGLLEHFHRFGMEIHTGQIESKGLSKSEVLFCSKPAHMYTDPASFDNTDLSDLIVGPNQYIPIVDRFAYLGSVISCDCSDDSDVLQE